MAHYNLFERLYSKLVLGGVPPGGDSQEAMADLERARELAPPCSSATIWPACTPTRAAAAGHCLAREAQKLPHRDRRRPGGEPPLPQMLPPLVRADARRQKRRVREGKKPIARYSVPA